jgi:5-methyltetrahydropteroyltriglutamate--homocysteine methyltransferase
LDVTAQLIGYPRIGPQRELKWTLERRWAARLERGEFESRLRDLRDERLKEQQSLIGSGVDDFFLYDEVLETALMLGVVPSELLQQLREDPFAVLTALARGTQTREAWEMTKWFDTNYHYVVPQITSLPQTFHPLPWRQPSRAEPQDGAGGPVIWPILGPYSLVKLAKMAPGLDAGRVARSAGRAIWGWVREAAAQGLRLQVDEPCLGLVLDAGDAAIRDAGYAEAGGLGLAVPPIVSVQFGAASADTLMALGRQGFAVQVPVDRALSLAGTEAWEAQPEHVISVMDGRSVWPDDAAAAARAVRLLPEDDKTVRLVPTTSFMFLPYSVEGDQIPAGFQFAREKARSLFLWAQSFAQGTLPAPAARPPDAIWPAVGDFTSRASRPERRRAQADLNLPPFPTTSTGSLPQTADVRHLRVQLARSEIDLETYHSRIADLITEAIRWQEAKGLDVLVHGEFERTDMVEYFAEQMEGFHTTLNGWVLSYGSRCTRPPILAAPPSIIGPMTVDEWRLAQTAASKPVKGMLTGPVTIVNWSFRPPAVPDDQLFWAVAGPIAEEVGHLVGAGARVVQIDEPAVRERWPLPTDDAPRRREIYARGVRAALNRVFSQPAHVQMHTHMCYGDFGDIVPLWSDAGVDVASIEFSRSKDDSYIRQFYELFGDGHLQIGPGIFDVHSPHSPGSVTMVERLGHFRSFMADSDLWVNPDCGLKTRSWDEIDRQIGDMVAAAQQARAAAR